MALIGSVTKIRGHYRVVIGSETYLLQGSVFRERPLREGDEIDPDEYDQWLLLRQYRPALDYAVSLLAQRPFASGELKQRLARLGCRPQTIEMVLYKLSSNGLLDDADFARQWTAARAGRNLGPRRIREELRRKGVSEEDAAEALEAVPEEEQLESASHLAAKAYAKAKAGEDPRKTAQRIMAMLVRRGYGYDLARQAIDAVCKTDEE